MESWVVDTLAKTKPDFQAKVHQVLSPDVMLRLITEPAADDIYPNKFMHFCDILVMGLGHFKENKNPYYDAEKALYEQVEPFINIILS